MPGHNLSVHGVQSRDVPNASVDGIAMEAENNIKMKYFSKIMTTSMKPTSRRSTYQQ